MAERSRPRRVHDHDRDRGGPGDGSLDALLARIDALEDEVTALRRQMATEPATPTTRPTGAAAPEPAPARFGRRQLLRQGGLAAGALAGGSAAVLLTAAPAAAATVSGSGAPGVLGTGVGTYAVGVEGDGFTGVWGSSTATDGRGVFGEATGTNGIGVGANGPNGTGLMAAGATGAQLSGADRNLVLTAAGTPAPSRTGVGHPMGTVINDSNGDLWISVSPGLAAAPVWRKVAGLGTAGAFHLLPAPKRIYDSRAGFPPLGGTKGAMTNTTRGMDATAYGSGVPVGATAVLVNLAVTNTGSGGYGALWRTGLPDPGTANINWSQPNTTTSNTVPTAVDAGATFTVKIAGTADVIIDVLGYFR